MLILVDQDGVLADFEAGVREACAKIPELKDHIVEYKDRKSFYVAKDYPEHLRSLLKMVYHKPGFFRNLPMVEGARDALLELIDIGEDVRICTSPLSRYKNCVLEKYEWVEKNLGSEFTGRMILTRDKTIVRGDCLIDDKPMITGALKPIWKHVVFDCPYNISSSANIRLTGWSDWRQAMLEVLLDT